MVIENRDPGHAARELESFPSGHLYWTTMCVLFVSHQFGSAGVITSGWMIPMMCFIRPHLGVHYPSDVIAGFIFGTATALLALFLLPFVFTVHLNLEHLSWYPWFFLGSTALFIFRGYRSWQKRV